MQRSIRYAKEFSALYESVEMHAQHLRQILTGGNPSDDVKVEVENLNRLLSSFTATNELMQRLLDCADAKVRRERVRAAFEVLRRRGIIEGSEPLNELRNLSNRTIFRTLALLKQVREGDRLESKEAR